MTLLDHLSDPDLIDGAALRLAIPRAATADSFVLHAPLELLARTELLRHAAPADRPGVRSRIGWLADQFDAAGEPVHLESAPAPRRPNPGELEAALDDGDVDLVDRLVAGWAAVAPTAEVVAGLADPVLARTAAAGHAAILLHLLDRVRPGTAAGASLVRGAARELARRPDWSVGWVDERDVTDPVDVRPAAAEERAAALRDALIATMDVGDPGSNFIHPTMSLVDRSGLARDLLDGPTRGLPVPLARRELLRVAAWSMVQDDPVQAPYGWTHALTMPQATLAIAPWCADPDRAVAVAATWVLGFRATQGAVRLDPAWEPSAASADHRDLLAAGPDVAASTAWHARPGERLDIARRLAAHAGAHEDAHLAKYTLACLDAAAADPDASHAFLAAAAFLGAWWHDADQRSHQ